MIFGGCVYNYAGRLQKEAQLEHFDLVFNHTSTGAAQATLDSRHEGFELRILAVIAK